MIFRPSEGVWYINKYTGGAQITPWSTIGDVPVAADADGAVRADFAVFRPDGANWFIQRSTPGILIQQFGLPGDLPVPASFLP